MILFVGNVLSGKGRAVSYTEFLVTQLRRVINDDILLISSYQNKLFRLAHAILFLLKRQRKIRLVVIDTFSTSAFYYAYIIAFLCRLIGKKYILVLHGGNLPIRYEKSKRMVKSMFEHAYRIVSPSFYLGNFFRKAGFDIEVIPNGLDISLYQFRKRSAILPRLLWVRAFDAIYNPVLAIKSLRLILTQFPSACLTMIGPVKDSSYQECVDYVKQYGLEKVVTFRGLLSRDQWIAESNEFDIFLNTTTIDNQPVSLLEAMALGFIVISTKVGGTPFLVDHGKNGLLVPSDDEHALAKTIVDVLEMPRDERGAVSENAREFAIQFDWYKIESKWIALLDKSV